MGITIKDVAKHFGVGLGTVSRAVNGSGYVRAELKEQILAYAREQNWCPSSSAKSLSTGKTRIIGIIVPGYTFYVWTNLIEEIRRRLISTEYSLTFCLGQNSREIDKLIAANVEAVLVLSPQVSLYDDIRRLIRHGILVFGIIGFEHFFPSAHSNHYDASYRGTRMLIENGHRRIGYFGLYTLKDPGRHSESTCIYDAVRGYFDAMEEAGLEVREERDLIPFINVLPGTDMMEENALSKQMLTERLRNKTHTAYFLYPVTAQMFFYILCRDMGIHIPKEVSLVGLEGDYFAPALNPPPTHFRHNYEEFADLAMDFIRSGGKSVKGQHSVNYVFIPGESIRKIQHTNKGEKS